MNYAHRAFTTQWIEQSIPLADLQPWRKCGELGKVEIKTNKRTDSCLNFLKSSLNSFIRNSPIVAFCDK